MNVRKLLRIAFVVGCLSLVTCGSSDKDKTPLCGDGGPATPASKVTVADFSYTPQCITVPLGTTVTWTNTGQTTQTVTSDVNSVATFDSGPLGENGVFTFTFNQVGVVDYRSTPFESLGMLGTVIVR